MDVECINQQKKDLRKRIATALKSLSTEEIERQSVQITSKALSLPEYHDAKALSIFLSMPGKEVSTRRIVQQAFRDGKKVYIPYIYASKANPKLKVMDMLRLRDEDDLDSLKPDAWGIPSLSEDSVEQRENALGGIGCFERSNNDKRGSTNLDLIFMPSMAFDQYLNRLGHGKGFYDRYLTLFQSLSTPNKHDRKVPYLVGLALKQQILSDQGVIPVTDQDWKVDRVVTSEL